MRSLAAGLAVLGVAFLAGPVAFAHDGSITTSFDGTGSGIAQPFTHQDADPWAGSLFLTVTNDGSEAWGDFHFEIFDPIGGQDISNVDWVDAATSSQSGLTWVIDNTSIGATIDLYFYGDPVMPTETATFTVNNVNPDQLSFFGVMLWPTPVPEPASLALLALGGLLVLRRR